MKILALDLSTRSTGFAVMDGEQIIEYGCLTASSPSVILRIKKISEELKQIVEKYPDIKKVYAEEVRPDTAATVRSLATYKALMWLQGQIAIMLHDINVRYELNYFYPSEWRKLCGIKNGRGIKREEAKQYDIEFVKKRYELSVNDDEADAIGIGTAAVRANLTSWSTPRK